jgi:cytochrome c peroxidase
VFLCSMRKALVLSLIILLSCTAMVTRKKKDPNALKAEKIEFGRQLFFDKALSNPDGQSCTVCHAPKTSFSDPNHAVVSEGMVDGTFVNRNSQSLAYVSYVPARHWSEKDNLWKGGLFWDGRSNSLEHQLSGPFFNPAEMNNVDTNALVVELKKAPYYNMYKSIYGKAKKETVAFQNMCEAIALFERSELFNEFSSKFDLMQQGKVTFTEQEQQGYDLFKGKAGCIKCHSMEPIDGKILFTDYAYHNIGVPRNEENPFYTTDVKINPKGKSAVDLGLGAVLNDASQNGKFRVPTLRNVQYTGPYFHNGYFKTLKEVVHFMNTSNNGEYPKAEVPENVSRQLIGSLHLNEDEEYSIVAFLLTLTDGFEVVE